MVAGQPVSVQSPARNRPSTGVLCGGRSASTPGRTANVAPCSVTTHHRNSPAPRAAGQISPSSASTASRIATLSSASRSYEALMTSCRYWPSPEPEARRPWIAVWLKTHWIVRPTVTTWSNGQTGRSNQRWTPVIGEARIAATPASAGTLAARSSESILGDPVERDGQHDEVGGDRLAVAQGDPRDAPLAVAIDRADAGRQTDRDVVVAEPSFEPRSVELPQRHQRDLQPEPVAVAEEAVDEDLARVADVHLLDPLVQGRDEHGGPVQVDRPHRLAVAEQPVGERLAGAVAERRAEARQPEGHAEPVAPAQVVGPQEAAGQVERGGQGARAEPRRAAVGAEEDDLLVAAEQTRRCRRGGRSRPGSCNRTCSRAGSCRPARRSPGR